MFAKCIPTLTWPQEKTERNNTNLLTRYCFTTESTNFKSTCNSTPHFSLKLGVISTMQHCCSLIRIRSHIAGKTSWYDGDMVWHVVCAHHSIPEIICNVLQIVMQQIVRSGFRHEREPGRQLFVYNILYPIPEGDAKKDCTTLWWECGMKHIKLWKEKCIQWFILDVNGS